MHIEDVTLGKIAVAGLLFNSLTPYNAALANFREDTEHSLDLVSDEHRSFLLNWLNDWGCRHLSKSQHQAASKSIQNWYRTNRATLFDVKTPLWELEDQEIETAADAYGSLKDRLGAGRLRHGDKSEVSIGPTAASKILFAIRPKALMPWDDAMRKSFDCDGGPESYVKYLTIMRSITLHIADLCRAKGFRIEYLPEKVGRPGSTVVELLNEYTWVRTRKIRIKLPSTETLTKWASLG